MADVTMSETEDCQRRFQAAVDVIHSLPRNGSYKPSYEVMLRFYGLYKQAVCGPCTVSRPGFWDPVGRYKWDAWNQMGDMSQEKAMAAYVDEMKKVAQEVIDTMAINEKTASYFYYFEPLYHVIHDMPRPPEALFTLKSDVELEKPNEEFPVDELEKISEEPTAEQEILRASVSDGEVNLQSTVPPCVDGQGLTSDSENEVFSDSVEQLDTVKYSMIMDGNVHTGACAVQKHQYHPDSHVTHMGTGRGGEGANDGNRPPPVRRKNTRRDGTHQGWREPAGSASNRSAQQPASGSGSGSGSGGGDETGGGPEQMQDFQLHQQIILALHQLREDMQNVMERLEVVESLATANNSLWRSHLQFKAPEIETKWWPFDISGRTLLLLLLWPFVTQGLFFLLKRKRKQHMCI